MEDTVDLISSLPAEQQRYIARAPARTVTTRQRHIASHPSCAWMVSHQEVLDEKERVRQEESAARLAKVGKYFANRKGKSAS